MEILGRKDICETIARFPIVIGLRLPKMIEDYKNSVYLREKFVDYVCNRLNIALYYDMLNGGDIINNSILPPRVGVSSGIRLIHEFVEDEELWIQAIPGRVFGEYYIPDVKYKCVDTSKDEIYEILFEDNNVIDSLCKYTLINLCENRYIDDLTQRISDLFNIFDGLDPRTFNKEKAIQYVFSYISTDKNDYLENKANYEKLKDKYRNPILHGGKIIFDIEPNKNEITKLEIQIREFIETFCFNIHSMKIDTWEQFDFEFRNQQRRLKL